MVARRSRPDPLAAPAGDDLRGRLDERTRELEECEARLRRLEEQGARFLAAAAHAVVNPLTIANSYLELVVSDLDDGLSDDQRAFIRAAHDATRRMRLLIDELIELASLETGAAAIRSAAVPCAELVEAMLRELQAEVERKNITVACTLDPALPPAAADAVRIERALRRLLERAIRVTPAGGAVELGASVEDGGLSIRVSDAGADLSAKQRAKVFDPVAQLGAGPGERSQGLALAVAQRQIRACGGTLQVAPRAGDGSTFTIRLRLA
jgi:signal transduction histidine kinase